MGRGVTRGRDSGPGAGTRPAGHLKLVTIAIAEDHLVVAEALATMLSFADGFEVVGIADSGEGIIEIVGRKQPTIALMDVSLVGLGGIEATRRIIDEYPATKVIILTMHDDPETVRDAIAAGASGFVPKNVGRDDLATAIGAVAGGAGFLHPSVTRPFLKAFGEMAESAQPQVRLTERERDVLEQLATGKSTKEIAKVLYVGEETVKTHLSSVYQKLGVADRVQAVAAALRRGLVK
ncbi:MAG TPA: response regulator transcription factor [Acidimicrobiales bacterium]|nr:response regulator transcription factor [Acidimicrobiales bacterium]